MSTFREDLEHQRVKALRLIDELVEAAQAVAYEEERGTGRGYIEAEEKLRVARAALVVWVNEATGD